MTHGATLPEDIVVPRPDHVTFGSGVNTLANFVSMRGGPEDLRRRLQDWILSAHPTVKVSTHLFRNASGLIDFTTDPSLAKEAYRLTVSKDRITIQASSAGGFEYGAQTLRQWIERSRDIPIMTVEDHPRFAWRGMHLDCSRHFFTVPEIKTYIDDLARYKFNVFHWHLIDEGGWRMESKKFPRLTEVGAWRTKRDEVWNYNTLEFPGKDSGKPLYGGFYTQDEIRDIVKYATARSITIVPEIEMPGHCLPALVAYPEVTCNVVKAPNRSYRTTAYCAGKEATFKFLEGVLDEVCALFPSKVIHIGGDEVDQFYWANCPDCKARMAAEHLPSTHELQSYFVKRMEKVLIKKGRSLMGWDEILEGGLAPQAAVMSWRGVAGGIAAAKAKHDVVMSPTSHCYFDFGYDATSTEHVYSYEPIPTALTKGEAKYVLGAQANVWTEWMPNFARVQAMIFPRVTAMSEVLWTAPDKKDYRDFTRRLSGVYAWLSKTGRSFYAEGPKAASGLIIFDQFCDVDFTYTSIPGCALRFTTDGTAPTAKSSVYTGSIRMTQPGKIIAATFINGKPTDGVAVVECKRRSSDVKVAHGLAVKMIAKAFSSCRDVGGDATSETTADKFDISPFLANKAFAVVWTGTIRIPVSGKYTFTLTSDDGSQLAIDGALVVDNDGLHSAILKSGTAVLEAGVYPVKITYFDAGDARSFKAAFSGPGVKGPLESLVTK